MIDWTSKWDIPAQKEKERQASKDKIWELLKPGGGKMGALLGTSKSKGKVQGSVSKCI